MDIRNKDWIWDFGQYFHNLSNSEDFDEPRPWPESLFALESEACVRECVRREGFSSYEEMVEAQGLAPA